MSVIIDARCGLDLGKRGRFRAGAANRVVMMGFGVYLRALALVVGGGVCGRRR
jgi:hypothetical protein